jgi:hypothetical protein
LARNNRDWHQLLELCSVFSVLTADGERLYDPRAYHDRLLLGLSGIMSEAELHQIRVRLHQGERQKAARGELRLPVPAGLDLDRAGAIILNPDEEVRARIELVFAKFQELHTARAVMRFLREEKLRAVEAIDQENARWRAEEPLALKDEDRAALQALGENLPQIWRAPTTTAMDRKRILRFVIREVVIDQTRLPGRVWLKIVWQTGAISEHALVRRVRSYRDTADLNGLRRRITDLNAAGAMDKEVATVLNQEGFLTARGGAFTGGNVWALRDRWCIPTVKINGVEANPPRWADGRWSVQGAATALGVTPQTIFDYLARGLLVGHQLAKGQPWQIDLSDEQIGRLRAHVQRMRRSRKEAS